MLLIVSGFVKPLASPLRNRYTSCSLDWGRDVATVEVKEGGGGNILRRGEGGGEREAEEEGKGGRLC